MSDNLDKIQIFRMCLQQTIVTDTNAYYNFIWAALTIAFCR